MVEAADPSWRDQLYDSLKALNIEVVVYVPDAGHAILIDRCLKDPEIDCFPLVNEFEAVGICVGAWLGGKRACTLIQSSGIGNTINALGLAHSTGAPFFLPIPCRSVYSVDSKTPPLWIRDCRKSRC